MAADGQGSCAGAGQQLTHRRGACHDNSQLKKHLAPGPRLPAPVLRVRYAMSGTEEASSAARQRCLLWCRTMQGLPSEAADDRYALTAHHNRLRVASCMLPPLTCMLTADVYADSDARHEPSSALHPACTRTCSLSHALSLTLSHILSLILSYTHTLSLLLSYILTHFVRSLGADDRRQGGPRGDGDVGARCGSGGWQWKEVRAARGVVKTSMERCRMGCTSLGLVLNIFPDCELPP